MCYEIFEKMKRVGGDKEYEVYFSMMEIYNEKL